MRTEGGRTTRRSRKNRLANHGQPSKRVDLEAWLDLSTSSGALALRLQFRKLSSPINLAPQSHNILNTNNLTAVRMFGI